MPTIVVKVDVCPVESVVVITDVTLKLNDEELEELGSGVVEMGDVKGVVELELEVMEEEVSEGDWVGDDDEEEEEVVEVVEEVDCEVSVEVVLVDVSVKMEVSVGVIDVGFEESDVSVAVLGGNKFDL